MSDVRQIRPGLEFEWEGQRMIIQKVGARILITRRDGSHPVAVPAADIAAALRGNVAPPDVPYLNDVEDRLSAVGRARLEANRDLLHLLLTGRRADQPDTDAPAPALDPAKVPIGVRRHRIAVQLADRARAHGSMKGLPVLIKSEMRRLQRLEERWRQTQTLVDGRYTAPRKPRTDPEVLDALYAFLTVQARRSSTPITALVRGFRAYCTAQNSSLVLPSDSTLWNLISTITKRNSHLGGTARNRASQMNVPPSSAVTRLATRPGELVLFDTTKSNVWVKDPRTGNAYRLDVTLAIDLATRCIVGLAITHTTTKFAVGLCLADVLRPKTSPLAAEWAEDDDVVDQPFVGRPERFVSFHSAAFHPEAVVVDNGKPYVTQYVTYQMARLGISYEPQRSYNPTDKAQVERVFRTIKDMFESQMPGFTGGSVHERGERPESEDLMTPSMYERRLRQCIDLYNHTDHGGLVLPEDPFARLSPYVMYGILAAKVGAIPDIEYRHDWVRFLPNKLATVEPSRVRVQRLNYKSPVLKELQRDPVVMKRGKLRIYYDPFDLRTTWCFDDAGGLHRLRWAHLRDDTPRFGEFHTNWAVKLCEGKRVSRRDVERILLGIFAGQYDGAIEPTRHGELADDLIRQQAAALTAGAHPKNARDASEASTIEREATIELRQSATVLIQPEGVVRRALEAPSVARDGLAEPRTDRSAPRARRAIRPYSPNRS